MLTGFDMIMGSDHEREGRNLRSGSNRNTRVISLNKHFNINSDDKKDIFSWAE